MHTAQAGIVFMGSAEPGVKSAASVWEDFRDSMRDLATDQVAAAIATGAFDEVDASRSGKIQGVTLCLVCRRVPVQVMSKFACMLTLRSASPTGVIDGIDDSRSDKIQCSGKCKVFE